MNYPNSRPATAHDILSCTVAICFFSLILIAMQFVVITKSTVSTTDVMTELRVIRSDYTFRDEIISKRLADIQALLGNELAKQKTLQQMEH